MLGTICNVSWINTNKKKILEIHRQSLLPLELSFFQLGGDPEVPGGITHLFWCQSASGCPRRS